MTDPTDRLVASTRRRLAGMTLLLIALLVLAMGVTTAIVGLRALDGEVDRALDASATAAAARFDSEHPSGESTDEQEATPASADTFVLYLDAAGNLVANPSRVPLDGLPSKAAVESARANGSDVRDVDTGGIPVRLETLPVLREDSGGTTAGFVQAGFVLTLHDQQSARLVLIVTIVGVAGLIGAAVVAFAVTGRALVPIRSTMAAQRRFVADASHELRTPATLIRSAAEILEREDLVAEDGRPFVADIGAEAERLGRLVGDLLTLASTDAGMLKVERGPLDLADVASETVRRAASLADERGVSLAFESSGRTTIHGDRDRLVQLMLILLDNASAHSPAGGTVHVDVAGSGRAVSLSVTDEGPGVPKEERERVFQPFHRLPGERRTEGGTGLGLAIARRLAAGHDATIAVDDAPDGGARFTVMFAGA